MLHSHPLYSTTTITDVHVAILKLTVLRFSLSQHCTPLAMVVSFDG